MSTPRRLEAEIAEREREAIEVAKNGALAVNTAGARARQIVDDTRETAIEVRALARLVELELEVLDQYLRALEREKLVTVLTLHEDGVARRFVRAC